MMFKISSCKYINYFAKHKQKALFWAFFAVAAVAAAQTPRLNAVYLDYIDRYKEVAMRHHAQYGVPASITLAQGLLESRAGRSYLAERGNNHFGIKCHRWAGDHVEWDDTLRHDCYRSYPTAEESFEDHARFLCTKRYRPLHELDSTDFRGWAQGLRDCGYAEDPAYPQKLVALIEQYELYRYDYGLGEAADTLSVEPPADETPPGEPPLPRPHERVRNAFGLGPSSPDND